MKALSNNKRTSIQKEGWVYTILSLPTIAYLILFKFIPFLGNAIAFMDYKLLKGIWGSDWVGFAHFSRLFQSEIFSNALMNTLRLNLFDLAVGFPFTIVLSLVLTQLKAKLRVHVQTLLYIPYFISWAALGGIIVQMLSPSMGVVAAVGKLFSVNYTDLPVLLGKESSWLFVYVLAGIWQYSGWGTIVYVSAIMNIDNTIYESAQLDGASRFQQLWYMTLPMIAPVVIVMFLLKIAGVLSTSFEQIYALSNPSVSNVADVLCTFEYRLGMQSMQFSYATAIGLVESLLGILFVLISRKLISKIDGGGIDYAPQQ